MVEAAAGAGAARGRAGRGTQARAGGDLLHRVVEAERPVCNGNHGVLVEDDVNARRGEHPVIRQVAEAVLTFIIGSVLIYVLVFGLGLFLAAS